MPEVARRGVAAGQAEAAGVGPFGSVLGSFWKLELILFLWVGGEIGFVRRFVLAGAETGFRAGLAAGAWRGHRGPPLSEVARRGAGLGQRALGSGGRKGVVGWKCREIRVNGMGGRVAGLRARAG